MTLNAISMLFGRKYAQSTINNATTDFAMVTFDTMVSEEHKFSSRVTYFPVETGTIVSDHIINQPDVVILSGLISDTPLSIFAPFNRSISAFNTLLEIHRKRQVVNIVTGIKVYRNMAITSLDVPRTVKTGQTLTFNIEFQRIVYDNDIYQVFENNNVFGGILDNTPRAIVALNAAIPLIQNDPFDSLKDQASSAINVGAQGLTAIPISILPNVLSNLSTIFGVTA